MTTDQANAILDALDACDPQVYAHFNRYLEVMQLPAGPTYFAETDPDGCIEELATFLMGRAALQSLDTKEAT